MPRYYDPTQSDPTIWLINKTKSLFDQTINNLTIDQIQKYIQQFKKNGELNYQLQSIKISNHCSEGNYYLDFKNTINSQFPAFFDGTSIIVCQNMIQNSVQLYQNLRREFEISEGEFQNDKEQICKLLQSCKKIKSEKLFIYMRQVIISSSRAQFRKSPVRLVDQIRNEINQ
ncbi:hypothetical protein pb186bvf_005753 [Paramecium bursaria]